jgi:hypothetical protein
MLQRQGVQVYDQNGKVKVSYEQITEGLAKAAAKGGQFEGALAAMGESISTKLSNVRDNITNIFVNLFEAGKGLFGPVLDGLNSVLSFIAEITKPGTGMDILIFLIRTVTNALIIQAGMWLVINAEVIALTISTWALFAAENAALLGIPLLIAGFGWLADKVGGVTNAFKVLANVGILALDIILAPFKFLYDLAKTGSIGEAFDIMVSDYKAAIGGVTGAYNEGVAEVDAANKKKSLAEKARAANYHPSAIPDNMGGGKDKGSAANKVQAPKITTINITIGNLVNELMVQTTNLKESPSQLREAIINILGGAINDSQLIVK